MLYIAKFHDAGDLILEAPDPDGALAVISRHGVSEVPIRLAEVPPGVFCAEVVFADEDAGDVEGETDEGDPNPANLSEAGVVLEPLDALTAYLELEQQSSAVIDVATPKGAGDAG